MLAKKGLRTRVHIRTQVKMPGTVVPHIIPVLGGRRGETGVDRGLLVLQEKEEHSLETKGNVYTPERPSSDGLGLSNFEGRWSMTPQVQKSPPLVSEP